MKRKSDRIHDLLHRPIFGGKPPEEVFELTRTEVERDMREALERMPRPEKAN